LAFTEIARENSARIEEIKASRKASSLARKAKCRPKASATSSDDPGEPLFSDNERLGFRPFLE
jgi:hypothetical protein